MAEYSPMGKFVVSHSGKLVIENDYESLTEEDFTNEFTALKRSVNEDKLSKKYPADVGKLQVNKIKNRSKDIPFDHNRVELYSARVESSDYINASYIKVST